MAYAQNYTQQTPDGARYYGDGYPDTRAQAPYTHHDTSSYGNSSTQPGAYNYNYDDSASQRPGTAAGYMQPSMRQHIASPAPANYAEPYGQHQQQYPEPAAVAPYYGAAPTFTLPSRPGTAPGHPNTPGGNTGQPYGQAAERTNGAYPAQEATWPMSGESNQAYPAAEMPASVPYPSNGQGARKPPPSFHKPQTGHRPPPQREDTYYSDPGADYGRGPISPVHPNAPHGAPPAGRAPPPGTHGIGPPRGPPGMDPRRGPSRDPRRGAPPDARPGRNGPPGPPRGGRDPRGDFGPDARHREGPQSERRRGPPGANGREGSGTRSAPGARPPRSPRPIDGDQGVRPPATATRPGALMAGKEVPTSATPDGHSSAGSQANGRRLSDALPSHPTPVRPGLMQAEQQVQQGKAPPTRQYDGQAGPQAPNGPATRGQATPVTHEELARLRQDIQRQPADQATRLQLAKKLVEATVVLADDGGRADVRTRNKNRERYVAEAHQLVKRLVAESYPEAQFYMADSLGSGVLGVPNDAKESFTLYQAAAKAGHAQAAYRTAVCCELGPEDGGGTRRDTLKAFQWYKRAAALGDQPSMYKVGMIQLKGLLGQEVNVGEAVTWLKRAVEFADEQNPHAMHELGGLYDSRAPRRLIESDDARALELFTKAANFGFKRSQFRLGEAYEYGTLGCPIDARNSIIWYTRAAAQGEHQSELALSGWYLTGSEGILEHSDTEAYLWARKAALAEPPLAKAMFALGYYTEVGIGCPRSLDEAKKWYSRAAAHKFAKAQERLEELRQGGARVQKNRENLSRKNQRQQEAECSVM